MATLSRTRHVESIGAKAQRKLLSSADSLGNALSDISEDELHNVIENFRAYLVILRKWDENESLATENSSEQDRRISVVDSGLG